MKRRLAIDEVLTGSGSFTAWFAALRSSHATAGRYDLIDELDIQKDAFKTVYKSAWTQGVRDGETIRHEHESLRIKQWTESVQELQ